MHASQIGSGSGPGFTGVGKHAFDFSDAAEDEEEEEEEDPPLLPPLEAEDDDEAEELVVVVNTHGEGISSGFSGSTDVWFGVGNEHSCCQAGTVDTPDLAASSCM